MRVLVPFIVLLSILSPELPAKSSPYVTVAISARDIDQCGGWPVSRRWYTAFIQQARASGAERIFIDIAFISADPLHPESDDAFYESVINDENVFLLHPSASDGNAEVPILGGRPFPARRTFGPFSEGMEFIGDDPLLSDGAGLTHALLQEHHAGRGTIISFPPALLRSDMQFVDALKDGTPLKGKDVILSVESAGQTSFVVSPSGGKQTTTLLQVWAAEEIRSGKGTRMLEFWMYLAAMSLWSVPFILFWLLRRSFAGNYIPAVLAAVGVLTLFLNDIYLPQWFLIATGAWSAAALLIPVMVRRQQKTDVKKDGPVSTDNEGANEEVEALRYQLKYYEQLSQQLPPGDDLVTEKGSGIIYHPGSPLADILKKATQIAASSMPVLVSGESGTGKEKLAQFIHQQSPRKEHPFIAVNCSSLSDSLIESELFGHEQGSFTGAMKTKMGRFELANGGTLFLDEIGETSTSFQAKILRVLQEGVVERVGGTKEIKVDVRIIAATNKNLKELTKKGTFREDLFYRLHGFELVIPALRDRRDDIEALFRQFLYAADPALSYSPQLVEWLKEQRWQGNVRQLQSSVQRAVLNAAMHARTFIIPKDFEIGAPAAADPMEEGKRIAESVLESLRSYGFDHRSIAKTSADLNLHRSTVTEYLRGWVIHFSVRFPDSGTAMFDALQAAAEVEDTERFHERIRAYSGSILSAVEEGIAKNETPETIAVQRFRKIPLPFRADISRLIEMRYNIRKK